MNHINEQTIKRLTAESNRMLADAAEKTEQRQASNLEIVELLKEFFIANPYMRFEQTMYVMLNGELNFNRESVDTLVRCHDFKQRNKNKF